MIGGGVLLAVLMAHELVGIMAARRSAGGAAADAGAATAA